MRSIVIGIMLLGGLIQGLFAQQFQITGTIRDANQHQAIEAANVVLQQKDSTFIGGTTTGAKGAFVLKNVAPGSYLLAVSSLGYETKYIVVDGLSKNVALGDILLADAAVSLDNVVVSASNQRSTIDRKIVFPSERQLKASTNGVNLLDQLMLPRVHVNQMSNEIAVSGGGEVQLRINGVKVEIQDVKALQPADIIRVEFHDNPGLRYGNAEIVLDYIVRRPETGGSLSTELMPGINALWGQYFVAGKLNHKRSEFGASYSFGPRDFYELSRDNEEEFHLADGTTLHRIEQGEPDRMRMFMHNLNLNYSNQSDAYLFNATFRYWRKPMPWMNYKGVLYNVADPSDKVSMIDQTDELTDRPALDLYYQRNLKHDQTLVFNVVGTYSGDHSKRLYQERREDLLLTDVNNEVDGRKYSLIAEGIYEKKLSGGNRLSGGVKHLQAYSNNDYRNGHDYTTKMTQAETYMYGEFKGRVKKFDYTLGVGASRYWFHQDGEGEAYQYYTFRPRVTGQYNLPGQSFIRLSASASNSTPSLSNLSAIEQTIDSLQIQRGNPNLKPYMKYGLGLTYELQKGLFYGNFWGYYEYAPDAIMDEKRLEGRKVILTWDNQRDWQRLTGQMQLRFGPFKDILQVSFTGGVNHFISRGNTYSHTYTNWFCEGQASLTYKNFSLMYMLITNHNWFWGETLSGNENIQMLTLGYQHKNLSVGVGMFNPFSDNYKVESENWSKHASYKKAMYIGESSRMVFAKLSYNFSFGRTFKTGEKRLHNSDNDSGVMSTGK